VLRSWDASSPDTAALAADLSAEKPDVVHIQFNWSYMRLDFLANVLDLCASRNIPCILQLHATFDHALEGSLQSLAGKMAAATTVIVHGDADARRLAEWGVADNVFVWRLGERAWPQRDAAGLREQLGIAGRRPVVATFGFLQPRKRTLETIRAVRYLLGDYPDLLLIAATALHPRSFDPAYYLACREEIVRSGLDDIVELIVRYLSGHAAMTLLQAADVIVLPYVGTAEGTSAAAKFCSAAGRPLVVSGEQLFDSFRDSALTLERADAESIAAAVKRVVSDDELAASLAERAKAKADSLSWDTVGPEYVALVGRATAGGGG
jgi:glycosyltransferase involved in cell wall biosynthesis